MAKPEELLLLKQQQQQQQQHMLKLLGQGFPAAEQTRKVAIKM